MANTSFDLNKYYQNIVLGKNFGKTPPKLGHSRESETYLNTTTFLLSCFK